MASAWLLVSDSGTKQQHRRHRNRGCLSGNAVAPGGLAASPLGRPWRSVELDDRGRSSEPYVTGLVRERQRPGLAKTVLGLLSDPPILAFSLSIGEGLMTISMLDRFWLPARRGRRLRIGMAIGLLEPSRLA
jgi:hypothetical protein